MVLLRWCNICLTSTFNKIKPIYKNENPLFTKWLICKWAWQRFFYVKCFADQLRVITSLIWPGSPNRNMLDYEVAALLQHVSRSTVIVHFKTNHLNRPGNAINRCLAGPGTVSQWWCTRAEAGERRLTSRRKGKPQRYKEGKGEWPRLQTNEET